MRTRPHGGAQCDADQAPRQTITQVIIEVEAA